MKFYRNHEIERVAEQRLVEYEQKRGAPISIPIDIELFGELVLDLSILWEPVDELNGEIILAGLRSDERVIVMNERRLQLFNQKPGLLRFTEGHEMGHWDLFLSKNTYDQPGLFNQNSKTHLAFRNTPKGHVQIISGLLMTEEGRDLIRQIKARTDAPDEARAVNRYAAAILMPREMIIEEATKIDRTQWPNLYRLAEKFGVTISSLCVRLEQLNLLYIEPLGRTLYASRDKGIGQRGFDY